MIKKHIIILAFIALFSGECLSQAAYILPSPTGKNDTITLYINVAQTTDGANNNALSAMLNDHPDDDVFLWSWQPAEPTVGNGAWSGSNSALKMTKVSDKLYSIRFKPTSFYGVDATEFFSLGISCLAKLQNGNAYTGEYSGEAKTEDLRVTIIPRLCDELYCTFPEVGKITDFVSITYDNTQEPNPAMQNLDPNSDVYLFMRAEQSVFNAFNYTTPALATTTPALKMKPVADKPGFFRITILPQDFFSGIVPETFDMKLLKFYALKPGYVYNGTPPYQSFTFISCD
jgi:hypothetical protein